MRDTDQVIAEVVPQIERFRTAWEGAAEDGRAARAGVFRTTGWVLGAGVLLALVLKSTPVFVVGSVIALAVGGMLYYSKVMAPAREVEGIIQRSAISAVVQAMEPGMTYSPTGGVPESSYRASRLFPTPDRYRVEDGLAGTIGQTAVQMSEVHAEEKHQRRDSKGRVQTEYRTSFRGLFMVADFHKHFRGTTRVLPDTAEGLLGGLGKALQEFRPFSSEQLVYLEHPEFEAKFVVYSTDQVEARYILSTSLVARILELRNRWNDDVRISFAGSDVYVAITHSGNLLEPKVREGTIPRDELERLIAEVQLCFDLVEQLNLNTRIWTKE